MRSPFPGMDPYLQRHWGDIHQRFITYSCDALQARLPGDLRARMQERVFVESPDAMRPSVFFPDIRVFERPAFARSASAARSAIAEEEDLEGEGGVAVEVALAADPIIMKISEPIFQGYIEVIDIKSGRKVITVVEVLSPINKSAGDGIRQYRDKIREMQAGQVSTVEIDLLRGGLPATSAPPGSVPDAPTTIYHASVWRAHQPGQVEVYTAPIRHRLPTIKIPLRPEDPDAALDLQPILDRCYRNGAYDDLDYRADPAPPLPPDDAAWADALLREQRRR